MSMQIAIFDTTLRDGEQSPGVSLDIEEKLVLAHQLDRLGVDVIEAGFPIASDGDFRAVAEIAKIVERPIIAALARVNSEDVQKAIDALGASERGRIHVFVSTSDIHLESQLGMTRKEVLDLAKRGVSMAKSAGFEVEFSPMDATRSDREYLFEVCLAARDAGADIINLPDTVGYTTPSEYYELFSEASRVLDLPLSAHCHNDLGLAVANSIAAIEGGASQVEVSINGIGERAGNCALEELVMALDTRGDVFNFKTNINTEEIAKTSRLVSLHTGYAVPPNKAVVGKNAFSHESGIHQDGVLKNRTTYEIMNPDQIGLTPDQIVLGKHSGRHALGEALHDLGYNLDPDSLNRCFKQFKNIADRKKNITSLDLEALVAGDMSRSQTSRLDFFDVKTLSSGSPEAEVIVCRDGGDNFGRADGNGAIDALFAAIQNALGLEAELLRYRVDSIGSGRDSLAEVVVDIEIDGASFSGQAVDADTIKASGEAYLRALDRIFI